MSPRRKVSLLADADYIKRIYSDEKSFKPCTTCSFVTATNEDDGQNNILKASERQKLQNIVTRRISKFYHLFDPMLDFLLINRYAMLNKQKKNDVETIPTDHIIVMHLADLPNNSDNKAVRPQLRIDKLEARAVSDLNDVEKAMLEQDLSGQTPEEYRIAHLVSYRLPVGGYIWTTVRTNSYDFNALIVGRVGQRALMERLIAFSQGINEIARGDRPDIYAMIKTQMKEARKEEVGSVSLNTRLVEKSSLGGEDDKENNNNIYLLNNKGRRRRGDDGNELTAKTCWRE